MSQCLVVPFAKHFWMKQAKQQKWDIFGNFPILCDCHALTKFFIRNILFKCIQFTHFNDIYNTLQRWLDLIFRWMLQTKLQLWQVQGLLQLRERLFLVECEVPEMIRDVMYVVAQRLLKSFLWPHQEQVQLQRLPMLGYQGPVQAEPRQLRWPRPIKSTKKSKIMKSGKS